SSIVMDSLLLGAKKEGTKLINGEANLRQERSVIIGVTLSNKRVIEADMVIATTGAWTNNLLHPLGISFKGRSQKGQIIHLQIPDANPEERSEEHTSELQSRVDL